MFRWSKSKDRVRKRVFAVLSIALLSTTTACGNSGDANPISGAPAGNTEARLQLAIGQVDTLAEELMARTGIPGMAIAVVSGGQTVYAKGFGVRQVGAASAVDPDTVFALASMSKSLGSTVVARQVELGKVQWETPIQQIFPWFTLADPTAGAQVTVGDMYAHRSGLPNHAGDTLEEMSFSRDAILASLKLLSGSPFRSKFDYTNYGMTAAATAVATVAGSEWADLAEETLYRPLGMTATSSRFADFLSRSNRAPQHVKEDGAFVLGPERPPGSGQQRWSSGWNTDRQSPSGGVNSSARDVARWMSFVLGVLNGQESSRALLSMDSFGPAVLPQSTLYQAQTPTESSFYYGFGFFVDVAPSGEKLLHHSGAYSWGTGTNFTLLPTENVGIVVLTNAWPTGVPEALCQHFAEVVRYGEASRDWYAYNSGQLERAFDPQGELAGAQRPTAPTPAKDLTEYEGDYISPFYQRVRVRQQGGQLELLVGPNLDVTFALEHWDGDLFAFAPFNDSAGPGSISKAQFEGDQLTLEYYNSPASHTEGYGVFTRVAP